MKAPNTRAGAKAADARLAELIVAVESGRALELRSASRAKPRVTTVSEVAERWESANRPRQNARTGEWVGWSPKTAKTHRDNFVRYILPSIGDRSAEAVTGTDLDDLYLYLEDEKGLSAAVVRRCHSQLHAMYNWAIRKKLVSSNPAASADPPKVKASVLTVPPMSDVRKVIDVSTPSFAAYIQIAATIGARRGTIVALRWGNVDFRTTGSPLSGRSPSRARGRSRRGPRPIGPTLSPSARRRLEC